MFSPILTVKTLKPLLEAAKSAYKSMYNFDISYMKVDTSDVPINTEGRPTKSIKLEQFGACWTNKKTIYFNSKFYLAIRYYSQFDEVPASAQERIVDEIITYTNALKHVMCHELAHEIYKNLATPEFKQKVHAEAEKFTTSYLKSLDPESGKYNEELFCEYLGSNVGASLATLEIRL